jgi:hypothetical protein
VDALLVLRLRNEERVGLFAAVHDELRAVRAAPGVAAFAIDRAAEAGMRERGGELLRGVLDGFGFGLGGASLGFESRPRLKGAAQSTIRMGLPVIFIA